MNFYRNPYVEIPSFRKAEIVKLFNKLLCLLKIKKDVRLQSNYLKDKLITFLSQNIKNDFSYINYVTSVGSDNLYIIDIFIESTKLMSLRCGVELMSLEFESDLIVDYAKIKNINNIKKFLEDLIKLNSCSQYLNLKNCENMFFINNVKPIADDISTENMKLFIDVEKYNL